MSKNNPAITIIVLAAACLSCTFLKDKVMSGGGEPATEFIRIAELPAFDPKAPLASPGAYIIRRLAESDPSLAAFADQVEAAERGAMKQVIDANPPQPAAGDKPIRDSGSPSRGTKPAPLAMANVTPGDRPAAALFMLQSGDLALPGMGDGMFFGSFAGFLKGMLAGAANGSSFNKKDSKTETVEGGHSTMNVEMGASEDGSSVFGMGMQTETVKNGVKANTEFQAKIDGQDCPNAEGQVPITIKMRLSGQSGSSRYTQDVTVFIRLVVDDNAEIASTVIDITQGTSRNRNGQEVYVETGETIRYGTKFSEAKRSNERRIQNTDNATANDVSEATASGNNVAYGAALGAIEAAKYAWQNGGCIKIEATAPGTVALNSTTSIPVKVRHKLDGSELAAKLDSTLTGEASLDPALIPRTPGTLTYVAPGEPAKSATISLTATCRRGRAMLDLAANTGKKAYRVNGVSNNVSFTGQTCDIDTGFSLDAAFPGGTANVNFRGDGTMFVDGGGNGCKMDGGGTYTLVFGDDGSGALKWTTTDKLTCPAGFSNTKTSSFSVTLEPAPDLSCP